MSPDCRIALLFREAVAKRFATEPERMGSADLDRSTIKTASAGRTPIRGAVVQAARVIALSWGIVTEVMDGKSRYE